MVLPTPRQRIARVLTALLLAGTAWCVQAVPLPAGADDEVIDVVPARQAPRAGWPSAGPAVARPPAEALALARRMLRQARADADPRPAGQAIALLQPHVDRPDAAPALVIALVDAEQYLHDFDRARARLEALVARSPAQPQAWLMLATLHRLQGRYAAADHACDRLLTLAVQPYADACQAENDALRGQVGAARRTLSRWLEDRRAAPQHAWLAATLGSVEELAGRDAAAEQAYRRSLREADDDHVALALTDLLLRQGRGREAPGLLAGRAPSDAVLLRVAQVDPQGASGQAARAQLQERFAQADRDPARAVGHARERVLAALRLQGDATAALRWAQANVGLQREPEDLGLYAEAAFRAGDRQRLAQARQLLQETGLVDRRLDRWR